MRSTDSIKEHVVLLTSVPYKDSDLIVNFLSRDSGKLSALIFRGRQISKPSSFGFQPGDLIEIEYVKNENRDFINILNTTGIRLIALDRFPYRRFLFHSYLLEIVSKISKPDLPASELFDILLENNSLKWTDESHLPFILWTLWRLIKTSGYEIDFSMCRHCLKKTWRLGEAKDPAFRKQYYSLEEATGQLICADCSRIASNSADLSPPMIKVLWLLDQQNDYCRDLEFVPRDIVVFLLKILNSYLVKYLELNLRTADAFEQLIDSCLIPSSHQ